MVDAPPSPAAATIAPDVPGPDRRRAFLVHGHDHGARDAVARVLTNAGLEPVILSEEPNAGRTIIEKFEAHVDVAFAVVLMTPDDRGATDSEITAVPSTSTSADLAAVLQPRARQNVILELGYFIGILGRSRVAALVAGEVERPSDEVLSGFLSALLLPVAIFLITRALASQLGP